MADPPPLQDPRQQEQAQALNSALVHAVSDLHGVATGAERLAAAGRLTALSLVLALGVALYWLLPPGVWGLLALMLAGVAYALLLIASHEMVHGTLLGWPSLEFGLGCLLSWPMAWPFATYSRLHRLHHRWNGCDGRDPERTQPLPLDPPPLGAMGHWLRRHPFAGRCLLLGGVGLIVDTAWKGWRLRGDDPHLDDARNLDGSGVTLLHGILLGLVLSQGVFWRYVLFWIALERVIGAIVQYRGLVEHHGLWQEGAPGGEWAKSHRLRQLATSRDVMAGAWLNALMGGLPHHSAHHAFPAIPAARLPEASSRLAAVLSAHGWPPPASLPGYGAALQGPMPRGRAHQVL